MFKIMPYFMFHVQDMFCMFHVQDMAFQSADDIKSYFAAKLPNARPLAVWKGMEYLNIDKDDKVSRLPLANDAIITALVCTQNKIMVVNQHEEEASAK